MYQDLLLVVKKSTNRVVFKTIYSEWPRMIPASPDYIVRRRQDDISFNESQWNSVIWYKFNLEIKPISPDEMPMYKVDNLKCQVAWTWLNVLHNANRSTMGMLPGIDLCDTMVELNHLEQERVAIKELIKNELKQYWSPLWNANTLEDVERIATELNLQNHLNQAVY